MRGANDELMIKTLGMLVLLLLCYSMLTFVVKKASWGTETKRKVLVNGRNVMVICFAIAALSLWGGAIKTMILSITALAAAVLIIFKEVIMCVFGSFVIASNKTFSLGDHIEIDGLSGEVIDRNVIYTKMAVGNSFKTKEASIPNSIFLTNKTINLSKHWDMGAYSFKMASVRFGKLPDLRVSMTKAANEIMAEFEKEYALRLSEKKAFNPFFELPKEYFKMEYDVSDGKNGILIFNYLARPCDSETISKKMTDSYSAWLELLDVEAVKTDN